MATESSEGEEEGKLMGGNQQLTIDDEDLREMAKKAAWSVSSCKPGNGVTSLRDDNLDTYWQSDGAQPHLVNIQFQKKVKLQLVVLYVDFKLDESYTPSKISIRAGDGFQNLKGNFCQYFHVANCCIVESSKWKRYPCAADKSLWASTEPHSSPTLSVHLKGVHYLLNGEMRIMISCVVERSTYHAAEFDYLKIGRGSLVLNIVV
ncbi:anaphase-promoting complex subunit 10 isoform X1 [Rhododendron vialii]|uniref:anaphase-promoting complex subunit 10 isoform X1 n=1 Tax=Rhododendron vialii TaxID=182163 RepID=UPI00265E39A4|nr:anaphase-promoting complex subunit 10 isoform X1 [Rhododendron vialii]